MSRLGERLDRWFPRRRGVRRLTRMASMDGPIPVSMDRGSIDTAVHEVVIRKERAGASIACNMSAIRARPEIIPALVRRPIRMFIATSPAIRTCRADISDGWDSRTRLISFCSNVPGAILVPDINFYESRGYAAIRQLVTKSDVPWRGRSDTVVWRGSTTGIGKVTDVDMSADNLALIPRTRMCLLLRDTAGVDAMLVNAAQAENPVESRKRLRAAGILGARIDEKAWIGCKFAIDIDGNTNAWQNLFTRLLLGCCVIKVASPHDYRQWYYDALVPWRHYVPVRADMGDLVEKVDWCRSNPSRCEEIATAGRQLAMAMTFEREIARGTKTLERALVPI